MIQQQEIANLANELNRRQDELSLFYAMAAGLLALSLMMFGLTMLYSTSFATSGEFFFRAQFKWAVIGVIAMVGVIFIGYRRLASWCPWMLVLVAVLLLWALFSKPINGAYRWIIIPGVNMRFQPSELAKVVLALYGAQVISNNLHNISSFRKLKNMLLPLGVMAIFPVLVLCGRDLGTTILISAMLGLQMLSGGLPKRTLLIVPILLSLLAVYVIFCDQERLSRVTSFWDPGKTELRTGSGYQLWNSQLALGSGGLTGNGFMKSRMKQDYLPESHTDFILAVVGEELGFIGLSCVVAAYLLFGYFGMKIALNSRSRCGMLLAHAITVLIIMQAGISIGVVSGALPTKGFPTPLISYGGSSLLMTLIMVGLLISVGLENVPGLTDNWPLRKKSGSPTDNACLLPPHL